MLSRECRCHVNLRRAGAHTRAVVCRSWTCRTKAQHIPWNDLVMVVRLLRKAREAKQRVAARRTAAARVVRGCAISRVRCPSRTHCHDAVPRVAAGRGAENHIESAAAEPASVEGLLPDSSTTSGGLLSPAGGASTPPPPTESTHPPRASASPVQVSEMEDYEEVRQLTQLLVHAASTQYPH